MKSIYESARAATAGDSASGGNTPGSAGAAAAGAGGAQGGDSSDDDDGDDRSGAGDDQSGPPSDGEADDDAARRSQPGSASVVSSASGSRAHGDRQIAEAYDAKKRRKADMAKAAVKFSLKPKNGIKYLQEIGRCGTSVEDIAQLLHDVKDSFSKTQIGEYLGGDKDFNKQVCRRKQPRHSKPFCASHHELIDSPLFAPLFCAVTSGYVPPCR